MFIHVNSSGALLPQGSIVYFSIKRISKIGRPIGRPESGRLGIRLTGRRTSFGGPVIRQGSRFFFLNLVAGKQVRIKKIKEKKEYVSLHLI